MWLNKKILNTYLTTSDSDFYRIVLFENVLSFFLNLNNSYLFLKINTGNPVKCISRHPLAPRPQVLVNNPSASIHKLLLIPVTQHTML